MNTILTWCVVAFTSMYGSVVLSQSTRAVSVFNAPSVFEEMLLVVSPSFEVTYFGAGQSPKAGSQIWVYFIGSKKDLALFPLSERLHLEDLMKQSRSGVLVRGRTERGVTVLVVNLAKTKRGIEFVGCLSALDVLRATYANYLFSVEEMEEVCSRVTSKGF